MQTISEVMTPDAALVRPDDSIADAAQLMRDWDVGALPVCNGKRLMGMITDRDITVRAVADQRDPADMRVADVMTDEVLWCYDDQGVDEVLRQMGDAQIRRMPVINRDNQLVGMVALGDLATRSDADTDGTLEDISAPADKDGQGDEVVRLHRPSSDQAGGLF
ncbi:CBS domain-containing protein [Noviherbaspirillum sp.]|uniref:CBS domain-containing protein n=1 Tax=Noviherbaspirillum sp. TaxID=1926288 RepID=UPI002FE23D84